MCAQTCICSGWCRMMDNLKLDNFSLLKFNSCYMERTSISRNVLYISKVQIQAITVQDYLNDGTVRKNGLKHSKFLHLLFLLFLLFISTLGFAQVNVKGRVVAGDTAVVGATVQVKGTNNATQSDINGDFSINAPSNGTLVISSVGFVTQEIKISNRSSINVLLQSNSNQLADVIVVGYGTQRKSDVTGSLSRITAETIQERPVTNLSQALQGKASGLNVATNIKPGELPQIRIRGTRSPNASNDPLYVVDGIPIVSALGVTSFSINDLNPNDIASVEILKDASATAIYGSRGANGVILVTTKKASKGRVSVNLNANTSLDYYKSLTDWIDAGQYIDRLREGLINGRRYQTNNPTDLNLAPTPWFADPRLDSLNFGASGVTNNLNELLAATMMGYQRNANGTFVMRPTTAAEQALGWPAQVPVWNSANIKSFDWIDAVSQQGVTQNYQVSVSAGTEAARLYLSLGYNNQKGVQRDQDFERFNINMNGDIIATKAFSMGISIIASLAEQNYGINANQGNTGSKDLYGRGI